MHLPVPNQREVEEFRRLYERRFAVTLSEEEAFDLASRLVQFVYLTTHALPPLRSQEQ